MGKLNLIIKFWSRVSYTSPDESLNSARLVAPDERLVDEQKDGHSINGNVCHSFAKEFPPEMEKQLYHLYFNFQHQTPFEDIGKVAYTLIIFGTPI